MPDGAAGRQFEYVLRQIAASRDGTAHTDRSRFEAGAMPELDFALRAPVARMAARFGSFEVASVEARTEFALVADLEASDGKKWRVSCRVEETPPHRIAEFLLSKFREYGHATWGQPGLDRAVLCSCKQDWCAASPRQVHT